MSLLVIYFDTNVVRYLEGGLKDCALAADVKRQIVISPITAIELISQIATPNGPNALASIHRMRDWLVQERAGMLAWMDPFYARQVFNLDVADELFEHLSRALNVCLASDEITPELRDDANALREFNEDAKRRKAMLLEETVARLRREALNEPRLRAYARGAIAEGIAMRVGADPALRIVEEVELNLGAYFEYHTDFICRACLAAGFNFFSREHLNDLFDAEQLLYLSDPTLQFVTCDRGYQAVARGVQGARVHFNEADDMRNPEVAPRLISGLVE